jgi:hypothetical protein
MNIELNKQEADALLALIDVAVKATGLQTAQIATHLANKINEASKQE